MYKNERHYFIEVQTEKGEDIPRRQETELRRKHAQAFISGILNWLQEPELKNTVSSIAITAFGQVQITCEESLITRIQERENKTIVAIRQSRTLTENLHRLNS